MKIIQSRPYFTGSTACDACVFGKGAHAVHCETNQAPLLPPLLSMRHIDLFADYNSYARYRNDLANDLEASCWTGESGGAGPAFPPSFTGSAKASNGLRGKLRRAAMAIRGLFTSRDRKDV